MGVLDWLMRLEGKGEEGFRRGGGTEWGIDEPLPGSRWEAKGSWSVEGFCVGEWLAAAVLC